MPKNKNLYILIALIAAVAALGIYLAFTLLSKPTAKPGTPAPQPPPAQPTVTTPAPAAKVSASAGSAYIYPTLWNDVMTTGPTDTPVGIGPQYNADLSPAANLVFNDPNPTALSVGI